MQVFIGGVMQASKRDKGMVDQAYRAVIADALRQRWPELEILDPYLLHPESVAYDDLAARQTLLSLLDLAAGSDLVIAYLPEASMGTALEMYEAYRRDVPVIAISPLRENWVLRAFARRIYPELPGFLDRVMAALNPVDLLQ